MRISLKYLKNVKLNETVTNIGIDYGKFVFIGKTDEDGYAAKDLRFPPVSLIYIRMGT